MQSLPKSKNLPKKSRKKCPIWVVDSVKTIQTIRGLKIYANVQVVRLRTCAIMKTNYLCICDKWQSEAGRSRSSGHLTTHFFKGKNLVGGILIFRWDFDFYFAGEKMDFFQVQLRCPYSGLEGRSFKILFLKIIIWCVEGFTWLYKPID